MANRTKQQHFIPRFYLSNFCDADGEIWTHDSRRGEARRSTAKNTAFETNIYSPMGTGGKRFDGLEEILSEIECSAAPILSRLLNCEKLDADDKMAMSLFLASMYIRSPAQIRQFAALKGDLALWITSHQIEHDLKSKQKHGEDTEVEEQMLASLSKEGSLIMEVDKREGLVAFTQLEKLSHRIHQMTWSFDVSQEVELITSDNPFFWVASEEIPASPYGFGLAHRLAVVPFPLSPNLMLRIDHDNPRPWQNHTLDRRRAKLSNRMRAQHKDHFLYYRTHHEGLHRLGMKYAIPVQQLDSGHRGPEVKVVRKLKE